MLLWPTLAERMPGLAVLAQAGGDGENPGGLLDLAQLLGSPVLVAGAAALLMQGIKANLKDAAIAPVAAVISLALLGLAWLLGGWSPALDDPRATAATVLAVVLTVVGPAGGYEVLRSLLRALGLTKPAPGSTPPAGAGGRSIGPVLLLALLLGALASGGSGCTAPATLGEQAVFRHQATLSAKQLEKVQALPRPWNDAAMDDVVAVFEARARWDAEVAAWSTGGASIAAPGSTPAPEKPTPAPPRE